VFFRSAEQPPVPVPTPQPLPLTVLDEE
jgi:hypothetical protein